MLLVCRQKSVVILVEGLCIALFHQVLVNVHPLAVLSLYLESDISVRSNLPSLEQVVPCVTGSPVPYLYVFFRNSQPLSQLLNRRRIHFRVNLLHLGVVVCPEQVRRAVSQKVLGILVSLERQGCTSYFLRRGVRVVHHFLEVVVDLLCVLPCSL